MRVISGICYLIHINNLTKRYEKLVAVNNLNLDIGENEVFGLLGPNGAGKTTLIHMLATLLRPTSGSATVNGFDIITKPSKVRSSIGIVFQAPRDRKSTRLDSSHLVISYAVFCLKKKKKYK